MTTISDEQLLARVARGHNDAVGELYDRHGERLYFVALRILCHRQDAEDAVHDTFVLVARRAAQYDRGRGEVATWLVAILRNVAIDATRRARTRESTRRMFSAERGSSTASAPPDEARANGAVRAAFARLAPSERALLTMLYVRGLTFAEIAEEEGIPIGTAKSQARRAIGKLRAALRDREVAAAAGRRGRRAAGARSAALDLR